MDKITSNLHSQDPDQIYDALIDIGKMNLRQFEFDVEKCLHHIEPEVRRGAIMVFGTYWSLPEFRDLAERIWQSDEDDLVRVTAFISWFSYYVGSKDEKVNAILVEILKDKDSDIDIRKEALRAIYLVNSVEPPHRLLSALDLVFDNDQFYNMVSIEDAERIAEM